jgi:hypothetical protein
MMAHIVSDPLRSHDRDVRCRRLLFRCWHRGTQESDFILGSFAEDSLRPWTAVSSGDSRRCSIARTPVCLTGSSASVIHRQNMTAT